MPSSYSIGAINDPYLLAALQTPNYYQSAVTQTQQTQTAGQTENTMITAPQQELVQPAEKSHKGMVASGILAIGATALCIAAHKKGNTKLDFLPRMKDGFENIGKSVSNWWKASIKNVKEFFRYSSETFQVTEKNGKKVCRIPEKVNSIHGKNMAQDLEKIGQKIEIKPLINENHTAFEAGSKIRKYEIPDYKGLNIIVVDGKPVRITDKAGENVLAKYTKPVNDVDRQINKEINEILSNINKGQDLEKYDLKKIRYQNIENDIFRFYNLESLNSTPELRCVRTKDFALDSKYAQGYINGHPEAKKICEGFENKS